MHNTLGASGKRREDSDAEDMQMHLAARCRIRRHMGSRLSAFFRAEGVKRGGGPVGRRACNKKKTRLGQVATNAQEPRGALESKGGVRGRLT